MLPLKPSFIKWKPQCMGSNMSLWVCYYQKANDSRCREPVGKGESLFTADGSLDWWSHYGNLYRGSWKARNWSIIWPSYTTPRHRGGPRGSQALNIPLGCPPELDDTTLLLKMSLILDKGHREIKLDQRWKLPCWLAFTCQEELRDVRREKVSMVLGSCESYNANLPRLVVPIGTIMACL